MKKVVISLSTAQERREHIVNEFAQQNIDFEFFDAITANDIDLATSQLGFTSYTTTLHQNEVGCLLSHMLLWKKAVDEQLDHIAIFEDDIYLGEHAKDFLLDETWIPEECEIVKLEVFYKKIGIDLLQKGFSAPDGRKLLLLREAHMGCGGYILSLDMAKQLLDFIFDSKTLIPVDHVVFRECPKVLAYQLVPALCVQDMILTKGKTRFPSALEDVRNQRKGKEIKKEKLKFNAKLNREFFRIFKKIKKVIIDFSKFKQGIKVIKIKFR